MLCPECSSKSDVADSRLMKENIIRRRRVCQSCKKKFTTLEVQMEELAKIENKVQLIGSLFKHLLSLDKVVVNKSGTKVNVKKLKKDPKVEKKVFSKNGKRILTPRPAKVTKFEVEPDWDSMTDEEIENFIGS